MHFDAVEGGPRVAAQSSFGKKGLNGMENPGLSLQTLAISKTRQRQRRFSRYRFDARIQLSVFRDGVTTKYWGRAGELSQDGIGATLSGELRTGEVVSLEFNLPLEPYSIKLRAVVRYGDGLRHGFEFLVMSDKQRVVLRQVCVVLANAS